MTRVLLFAADLPPNGDLPASGGGIRALQLSHIIESGGHDLIVSAPTTTFIAKQQRISEAQRRWSFSHRSQSEIIAEARPDVVVYGSSWTTATDEALPEMPFVLDLCGPILLESALITDNDPASLLEALRRKTRVLAAADLLLCGGERQQWYLRSLLALSGYDILAAPPLSILPMGCDPAWLKVPRAANPKDPTLLYAGGLYPWQDPSKVIRAALRALEEQGRGHLLWIGGSHRIGLRDRLLDDELQDLVTSSPRGVALPYLGLESLNARLAAADLSLEVMDRNLERELAVTTRGPHGLALGVPPLLPDYAEVAPAVTTAKAGWSVDSADEEEMARRLGRILADPEELRLRSIAARAFAENHLSWDIQGQALRAWLKEPRRRRDKGRSVLDGEPARLTSGERWLLDLSRRAAFKPLRGLLRPFFSGRKRPRG